LVAGLMKTNNRILIGVVVIAVIVLFVFFGWQKEQISFSDGVDKINALWSKNGLAGSSIDELSQKNTSLGKLDVLNNQLLLFQSSLKDYEQSDEVKALNDFTEIQLYVVEELKLALKIKQAKNELDSVSEGDFCLYFGQLNSLGENTILLNQQMKTVNEAIYSFSEDHSVFVGESNLESFLVNESDFNLIITENQAALENLKKACK
jgi:hypothetical protein